MTLLSAIPALPVLDIGNASTYYIDRLGFTLVHADDGFAVLVRDNVRIHLWAANDPNTPGAEPHLAGSASCRISVSGIEELYEQMRNAGVLHPNGSLREQPWGERDFTVFDLDRNCISFAERAAN